MLTDHEKEGRQTLGDKRMCKINKNSIYDVHNGASMDHVTFTTEYHSPLRRNGKVAMVHDMNRRTW
jgi:hypothetical protein